MTDVVEIWADSGVVVERDFTADELAQRAIDEAAAESTRVEAELLEAQRVAVRDAAVAHAKSLGFTDEMIAVMYPGLVA
jgi:hypothetical protein